MANGSPPPEGLRESSLGELVQRLANETSQLVHQEIELAKAEMTEKGKRAGIGAGNSVAPASWGRWPSAR